MNQAKFKKAVRDVIDSDGCIVFYHKEVQVGALRLSTYFYDRKSLIDEYTNLEKDYEFDRNKNKYVPIYKLEIEGLCVVFDDFKEWYP